MKTLIKAVTNGNINNPYLVIDIDSEVIKAIEHWQELQGEKGSLNINGDMSLTFNINIIDIVESFNGSYESIHHISDTTIMVISDIGVIFKMWLKHCDEWFETFSINCDDILDGSFIISSNIARPYIYDINPYDIYNFPHGDSIDKVSEFFEKINGYSNFRVSYYLDDVIETIINDWESYLNMDIDLHYIKGENFYIAY